MCSARPNLGRFSFAALLALSVASCSSKDVNPVMPTPATEPPPVAMPAPAPPPAPAAARYRVTFQATWSASSHPTEFPATAHFSPLVGGTHGASVRFWASGMLATPGIRAMAEGGRTTPLDQEIRAAIAAGTAEFLFTGGDVRVSPGVATAEFDISQTFPFVTLVSMIAPSPDWFVGVTGLPLFENGRWVDEQRVELLPWDAGTDSGTTFNSPDRVTTPPQPVVAIETSPLAPGGRVSSLGTFTFTRLSQG